jgi:hypothetical protein
MLSGALRVCAGEGRSEKKREAVVPLTLPEDTGPK